MLTLLIWIVVIVLFCFSFVLLFGAPFLPTLAPQIDIALDLLDLKPGETMLELGCGDGRVLIKAAKRGIKGVGYELNPFLVVLARLRTWPYRKQIRIVWGDYWRASWPQAEGMFVFILDKHMGKLHKKVMQYRYRPLRIASFAFKLPDLEPATIKQGVFLYEYKDKPLLA